MYCRVPCFTENEWIMTYILAHDVGTTGTKSCLYRLRDTLELVDACLMEYPIYTLPGYGIEQHEEEWWHALCHATRTIMARSGVNPRDLRAMSFCAQMQGALFVDEAGHLVRRPMIYMDGRAISQMSAKLHRGIFRIKGYHAWTLLQSLHITGGLAATPKDPLWKYHWVRENEPQNFKRIAQWLDVKDYLALRCTGKCAMTRDSANITFLYDTRPGKWGWHQGLCRKFDVNPEHLPKVIRATDIVGELTDKAAAELGIAPGIPVFGGGGDVPLTAIGSGAAGLNDTHVYAGTSGWIATNVAKRHIDINNFTTSILGADDRCYVMVGEQETSGACMRWVRDHLALDEIGIYLSAHQVASSSSVDDSLFAFMDEVISTTPPGAGNVIFTPWLHGNRAPKQDVHARSMFFNIHGDTGKRQLIRAVLEGISFHKRWILEAMERKLGRRDSLCFVGGGAKSQVGCQIMADVMGRNITTIADTQNTGAIGATLVCLKGLGLIGDLALAREIVPILKTYTPRDEYAATYDKLFQVFIQLYAQNRKFFQQLNDV